MKLQPVCFKPLSHEKAKGFEAKNAEFFSESFEIRKANHRRLFCFQ